jgi:hypothetical protein
LFGLLSATMSSFILDMVSAEEAEGCVSHS